MLASELSANDSEETTAIYLSKFEPPADIMSGERCKKLFRKLNPKPNTVSKSLVAPEKI